MSLEAVMEGSETETQEVDESPPPNTDTGSRTENPNRSNYKSLSGARTRESEAGERNILEAELSTELPKNTSRNSGIEGKLISNVVNGSKLDDAIYDNPDEGAAVILWYVGPEDGKIYFVLELKTGHPNPKIRGKHSLIGETAKVWEHAATETLVRGLKEEDPDSYPILHQTLRDNGYKFDEIRGRNEGRLSTVTIYAAQVKGLQNIEQVKYSRLTEGQKVIASLEEIVGLLKSGSFAYGGEVIRDFIVTNFHEYFAYKPKTYASDISFKHNPFQLAIPMSANTYNLNPN
ncbi:hypothetical protein HYX00_06635 [Candidatus Woesearchaeota archaeon]|nr:hypothetical protein [Candidatus Woesearchaeota archaeon]